MLFVVLGVMTVLCISTNARSLREALIYGAITGVIFGVVTGALAGIVLADTWRMSKVQAILTSAGIEAAWKGPLLTVLCAIGYAMRGGKAQKAE
jgi:hypothetical protein